MAKQKGRKKNRKWVCWVVCLVLLIVAAVATFVVWNTYLKPKDEDRLDVTETEEVEESEGEKIESGGVVRDAEDEESGGKKVVQYEGENPNNAESLTGVITFAGWAGENLQIRTSIDQFLSEGTCELMVIRNGQVIYTEESGIIANASTSSCQGFDVAAGSVGGIGSGAAQININLNSGGKTGTLSTEVNL